MTNDKILLNVKSLESLAEYEKLGISNFLFPLKGFSVGYDDFSYDEIESTGKHAFVLLNRLLTDDDIDKFEKMRIPSNVEGFVVEDIGLYEFLSKSEKKVILFQNHLNANRETVSYWLNHFDSLVISTDITEEEIISIMNRASKPLILYTLGKPMIMYSRRKLITNFYDYYKKEKKNEVTLDDPKGEFSFFLRETEYGTSAFNSKILDSTSIIENLPKNKILFYLCDAQTVGDENMIKVLKGEKIANTTEGFLHKKTVFRIGDLK